MARRNATAAWVRIFSHGLSSITRSTVRAGNRAVSKALKPAADKRKPPPGTGDWIRGVAVGAAGARHYRLYRPAGVSVGEHLPLMVMLHGCGQDAKGFAMSTRMNQVAARERFLVLYPEQDRLSNVQGCWNWFDTTAGRAYGEVALILKAIDQVCLLYPADRNRVAVAGLSAGASMAALLVSRHPERFCAVVMHSGIPPGSAHSTLSAIGAMHGRRVSTRRDETQHSMTVSLPPLLVIHGEMDHVVAASNAHAAVQAWADAAGARPCRSRIMQRGKRYPMTVSDFKRGAKVVATRVEVGRLGHAWSGGSARLPFGDAHGPDASRMAWAFAARQFRH